MSIRGYYQYYVEGEDERALLAVLKTEMELIVPGKIDVLNVVQQKVTSTRLMSLKKGTTVVLVFDTDAGNTDVLKENLEILNKCSQVNGVICIPQVNNLEDELIRSCDIKQIKELLGSKSNKDYKHDLISEKNLKNKLLAHSFNMDEFWAKTPQNNFKDINNQAASIKK